ncbi:MAG: CapA family protein [Oscillospiraceae bacterium]|nr:CapA family protein [Oscillospiraceae bacterium]
MKKISAAFGLTAACAVALSFGALYRGELPDNEPAAIADPSEIFERNAYGSETGLVTVPIADFKSGSLPELNSVSVTFVGDCVLAANLNDTREDSFVKYAEVKEPSYFFENAVPCYAASDYVIASCETVLSDRSLFRTEKEGEAFWFKSPSDYAGIFSAGCIDAVNLSNNHTYDYGTEGYEDTISSLTSAGIAWGDTENPIYFKKNGVTVAVVCARLFNENSDNIITPAIEGVMENSDIQILYFHGGEEYEHVPEDWMTELCHKYVDMGVDLIVGSHPHVLRPMEEYNGVDIVYSIGNFCYGANRTPENRTVIFTETFYFNEDGEYEGAEETITPFYVYTGSHNNWQPAPVTDSVEASKTMSFMYGGGDVPNP